MKRHALTIVGTVLAAGMAGHGLAADRPLKIAGAGPPLRGAVFTLGRHTLEADALPQGRVDLGGIAWNLDAGAAWRLDGQEREPLPATVFDEPVTATHLCFLHTFQPGRALHEWRLAAALAHRKIELPPEGPTVFAYVVTYDDGTRLRVPVRFGESIDQWYRAHTVGPMLWARPAWVRDLDPVSGEKTALYAMTWPNPRPERGIRSIAAAAHDEPHRDYGDALVLGITARKVEPSGRAYYVDPTLIGSDQAPGTFDEPFRTAHRAAEVVKPGDTVYLRRGLYALDRQVVFTDWGFEKDKWLTISAYPGETPVFDAFGILADPRAMPHSPDGTNAPPYQHDAGAIHVHGFDGYVRVQGLHVRRSRIAGISVYGRFVSTAFSDAPHADHVEIRFNTTDRCHEMGIITHYTDNLKVVGNRVCRPHSEQMVFTVPGDRPANKMHHGQEGIDLSRNRRFEVAFNEVYGGGKEAIDLISVQHGRVHHNYVHSSLNGIYIDSWSEPIYDLEVDHNYIHNAYSGIPCSTEGSNKLLGFRIHHNIVFDSKSGGISISEATYKARPAEVRDHWIYHNTIDRCGYHADAIDWLSSGIRVAGFVDNPEFGDIRVLNNIVTRSAHLPMSTPWENPAEKNIFVSHNVFSPPYDRVPERLRTNRSYPGFKLHLGEAPIGELPRYVDAARGDFRLSENSPARGAGLGFSIGSEAPGDPEPDLGALPYGSAWAQGMDWAGRVTAFYEGSTVYRPVRIPPGLFTAHRNHLQRPSWFQVSRYGPDLQHLPAGKHSWAGITWFIEEDDHNDDPTVLVLNGVGTEVKTERIDGIPVGRKADSLAFLQTYHQGPALQEREEAGDTGSLELFHYLVHYADGHTVRVPVTWRQDVAHWQNALTNLPGARLAWTTPIIYRSDRVEAHTALYAYAWSNPKPETVVTSIDLVRSAGPAYGAPAVLAISTGHAP